MPRRLWRWDAGVRPPPPRSDSLAPPPSSALGDARGCGGGTRASAPHLRALRRLLKTVFFVLYIPPKRLLRARGRPRWLSLRARGRPRWLTFPLSLPRPYRPASLHKLVGSLHACIAASISSTSNSVWVWSHGTQGQETASRPPGQGLRERRGIRGILSLGLGGIPSQCLGGLGRRLGPGGIPSQCLGRDAAADTATYNTSSPDDTAREPIRCLPRSDEVCRRAEQCNAEQACGQRFPG